MRNEAVPNGLWFKGKFIKEGEGLYLGTSDEFFRGGLEVSRCLKAGSGDAGVCVRFENIKIKSMRDFHRECRVFYRAMRKLYGIERAQDECLRVFKVVFPLMLNAKKGGEYGFDDVAKRQIEEIFMSWNIEVGSKINFFIGKVFDRINEPFTREEFITFCEDILVVVMRIRKLSPRECGRLMGVSEKDLDIMLNCGVSKSALYKLFGNSIVSGAGTKDSKGNYDGVLFNLFRKMFIETEPDIVKGEAIQLDLF